MRPLLALVLLTQAAVAAPAFDAAFADVHELPVATVHDVVGYQLPPGGEFTHVAAGRYDYKQWVMTGVVLLQCTATECTGRRAGFGGADAVEILGVVDLQGEPGPLPARKASGARLAGGKAKFPALVVRTTDKGTKRVYVVSLVDADRASVIWQDTAADAGMRRTYRTEKSADPKEPTLEIVATEQRRSTKCKPEPVEQRFKPSGHHFKTIEMPPAKGC